MYHQIDHELTRRQTDCPFCKGFKDQGLVACWPCFRSSGLKYGKESAEAVLDEFEDMLIRREDEREAADVS